MKSGVSANRPVGEGAFWPSHTPTRSVFDAVGCALYTKELAGGCLSPAWNEQHLIFSESP